MAKRTLTILARFEAKFTKRGPNECWEWSAGRDRDGYGDFWWDKTVKAHRASWLLYCGGPIEKGLGVLHRCDNPPCVNPDHLFLGTTKDNNTDMAIKERGRTVKLTASQIPEIRARLANGEKAWKIAKDYGVTGGSIYPIQYGNSWRHVK